MKLSMQCYTVRDALAKDLWGTFEALRRLGLNYVEVGGDYGISAEELRKGLDRIGLKVSGNHASIEQLEGDLQKVIDENRVLGTDVLILSSVGRDRYGRGWQVVAKELEPIGAKLLEAGIVFGYHNHAFEFQPQGDKPGLDVLYESSDAKLLQAQLDTYWVAYGGQDPAAYIRKMKGRVPVVHLKDGKLGGSDPVFLEVGQGDLDWDDILEACVEAGVQTGAIEQDTCARPSLESARMSVEFLRSKGVVG